MNSSVDIMVWRKAVIASGPALPWEPPSSTEQPVHAGAWKRPSGNCGLAADAHGLLWCAQGQHSGSMNNAKASRCQAHHQDDRFDWPANAAMPAPAWRSALLDTLSALTRVLRFEKTRHRDARALGTFALVVVLTTVFFWRPLFSRSTSNQRSGVFTRGLSPGKLLRPLHRRCCAGNRW